MFIDVAANKDVSKFHIYDWSEALFLLFKTVKVLFLPVKQKSPVQPCSHPSAHFPVILEHGLASLQRPQSNEQFGPYLYGKHSKRFKHIIDFLCKKKNN